MPLVPSSGGHPSMPQLGPPPMPPMGGPPGMGGPPPGMGGLPGMGGGFPSTDPSQIAPMLGPIRQMQLSDQQNLESQQQSVLDMLVEAMRNAPNPLAQASQTAPGFPLPAENQNA